MLGTALLMDFSKLLLKYGASLEDIVNMAYTQEELDPSNRMDVLMYALFLLLGITST